MSPFASSSDEREGRPEARRGKEYCFLPGRRTGLLQALVRGEKKGKKRRGWEEK